MPSIPPRKVGPFAGFLLVFVSVALISCGTAARLPVTAGMGPQPDVAEARQVAHPAGQGRDGEGLARGRDARLRGGHVGACRSRRASIIRAGSTCCPNGDVLVAETNAPPRPEDGKGIKGWFFKRYQKKAGGAVPSANRITLLRDADGDGVAEVQTVFLKDLKSPFGMALVGSTPLRRQHRCGRAVPLPARADARSPPPRSKVVDLPGGPLNHHWTKSLIASPDGSKLYVGVGSNSNVAENGIEKEEGRAAIWEIDPATGTHRVFASGLRNPVGMAWEPETGALWAAVNERDELGSDLVPDYMTSVRDGAFYGWPYSYYGAARGQARQAAAARPGGEGDRARLRARPAHGLARPRLCGGDVRARAVRATGCSSASTARGTASRAAATRSSSCRSRTASPPGTPMDVLTGFVRDERRGAWAARSAWRSTGAAACSSRTTWATASGG